MCKAVRRQLLRDFFSRFILLTNQFSIEELADETGFDKRVIRSFIEQGLLCGPDTKGRYARYNDAHVFRLKAIKALRENRRLNIAEIRNAFLSMSEEDIKALAGEQTTDSKSVLDYLRTACGIGGSERVGFSDSELEDPQAQCQFFSTQSPVDRLLHALTEAAGSKVGRSCKGQTWHRFAVTPDVEITVRGLQDRGQVEQWDKIADCLRQILLGGNNSEQ